VVDKIKEDQNVAKSNSPVHKKSILATAAIANI
jgi:hypothetical protein